MPKTNEVVMKVPEDMLAEMQAYMERLKLTVNKKTCKQEEEQRIIK